MKLIRGKRGALVVIFSLGVSFFVTSCSKKKENGITQGKNSEGTAVVEKRSLEYNVETIGDLTPSVEVEVKAEISGRIKAISIRAGQSVKRGDLVAELDDTDFLTEKASDQTYIFVYNLKL